MSHDTMPNPGGGDGTHDPWDLPLPLICLGGAYIPLDQRSGGDTRRTARGFTGGLDHHSFMLRRQGKKMVCVDQEDAHILGMHADDVRVERKEGRFAVMCGGIQKGKDATRSQSPYLSVPLHFGLELVQGFPKSYLWLSRQSQRRKNTRIEMTGVDEIQDIPVYSIPNLNITQICDTQQHLPVEYKAYFVSKKHLMRAWKSGRQYLTAASLAGRQQRRQHVFDSFHAKAAVIASRGGWFGPPRSSSLGSSVGVNEDEDGLIEPAEVQELAAELGMGGMPQYHDDSSEPSFIQNAKSFMATCACGAIATLSPIIQGCSMVCDSAITSVPLLDRLILGDAVPPRRAIMKEESMIRVLESVHASNIEKLHSMEQSSQSDDTHTTLSKRLALSALWMGISMKLLLQQQMMGSSGASVLIASIHNDTGVSKAGTKAQDPLIMDVLSSLIGSLQANDFVKTLGKDGVSSGNTTSRDLENILSLHNGLNIEYKKDTLANDKAVEGILFIGDITTTARMSSSEGKPQWMSQQVPPVGVHNGRHFIDGEKKELGTSSNQNK